MSVIGVVLATVVVAATSVHLPVSSTHAGAQAAVDRGLFLYYAYDGDDAAREFAQAAALDSRLAMAYWGIALANGPDLNTPMSAKRFNDARNAIARAVALESGASLRERTYIDAIALRFRGAFADWRNDDAAYRQAMMQFARAAHDENAQLLAAEALIESSGLAWKDGVPASQDSRDALELVTDVLKRDPANPMANHLCIHLYDLAADRGPALPCTQRLDAAAFPPAAEHLAHMPAHYWIETGNYAAAISSSNRAYTLLMQRDGSESSLQPAHYGKHDIAVGYSAAMMLGDYAVAQRWAHRMASVFDESFDALTALRFGRYVAAYAASGDQFAGESVHGLAAIHLGRLDDARAIGARLRKGNTAQGYLPQLFLGRLAESDGKFDEAERWIERARTNQHADFSGELIPLFPAEEALGELDLRRGENAPAVAAFRDALDAYPNDPRALFGLATALDAQGERAQAAAARTRFAMEWKGADTNADDALP